MSIFEGIKFIGHDERKRGFLLPEKIVKTSGIIEQEQNLLMDKPLQIGFNEPYLTLFKNEKGQKRASVILDFGREINGGIRLIASKISGNPYAKLRLTFGESLTEAESRVGFKGATNDHTARQFTVPIMDFSDQTFGETGFRFVKIELLTPNSFVKLKSAVGVFVYRDYEYKGNFECDDAVLNKIYDTSCYTVHLCCQNMLWDGIKRDRLVWIGDMMVESKVVHDIFGNVDIVPKSLEFIRDLTPVTTWMNNIPSYSAWWIMLVKDWFMQTGDAEFLNRQKDYCLKLIARFCDIVSENGDDSLPSYFLDWPTNSDAVASKSGVRALMRLMFRDAAFIADYFGENELFARCEESRNRLSLKIGEHHDFKQVVAMMSLADDMESESAAILLEKNGTEGLSTFMAYFQLKALAEGGKFNTAIKLMKDYYAEMLNKGATTFFEDYHSEWGKNSGDILGQKGKTDIHSDYGDYCYKRLRHSLCHGWSAGPVPFINEYILGFKVLDAGCKKIEIKPNLGHLKYAKGNIWTPFGVVKIEHTLKENGQISTKIEAPKEITVIKVEI
jgi:hypothetical protein